MNTPCPKIELDSETLSDLEKCLSLEWIVTNGIGGYCSSTVLGINTRKYHGLLVASFTPPVDRRVMLSKFDEQLAVRNKDHDLGSNEFGNDIYPQGFRHLKHFSLLPLPRFEYSVGEAKVVKTILMPQKKNAIVAFYKVNSPETATLRIFPLVNFRHFHTVMNKDQSEWNITQRSTINETTLEMLHPQRALTISSNSGKYTREEGAWIRQVLYRTDRLHGTSCFDDYYVPGRFEVDLKPNEEKEFLVIAIAGKDGHDTEHIYSRMRSNLESGCSREQEEERAKTTVLLTKPYYQELDPSQEKYMKLLTLAADTFIVDRLSTKTRTVIAGYHWFEDWGRDSLISLPGLTLTTRRYNDAREILLTFMHYCKDGVIPNRFPDQAGENPAYNTVDATLWYFNAVLQYLKYTNDFSFVERRLWKMMQSVISYHSQGTINNICLDNDGLLSHGPQLTWMDATVDNNPITPRKGKAVEIQALWYNALAVMELLSIRFGNDRLAEKYLRMAEEAKRGFLQKFWNESDNCLYDVVDDQERDASIRPNQILAVSLDFSMLDKKRLIPVVSIVREKLWATYGLRTLSPDDDNYHGKYSGNWVERNKAYHNGTAWAWLVGPFVTAFLKTKNHDAHWRRLAFSSFLQPLFRNQMLKAGLGSLSEVFDGDAPHSPGGCISQAWSVAEPLRAYIEDVLLHQPNFERHILEQSYSKSVTKTKNRSESKDAMENANFD
ncbi:MAG: glycogen debranching enzyme family protein [Candidatus Bathyarchaeota archaeon]|nr:MAG: glycogen debranching enzyme family protein [Candidatus Bathyarchaeota archaeon]